MSQTPLKFAFGYSTTFDVGGIMCFSRGLGIANILYVDNTFITAIVTESKSTTFGNIPTHRTNGRGVRMSKVSTSVL